MSNLPALVGSAHAVQIRQQREWAEILTDWETKNRYEIALPDGSTFVAGEVGGGLGAALTRGFLKNKRPFTIEVREGMAGGLGLNDAKGAKGGGLALRIVRPWTWLFARVEIFDGLGAHLGSVQQRFSLFSKRFDLKRADGQVFAELRGPLLRPWTFHIEKAGQAAGRITKKWSGLFQEMASDADNFGMELTPAIGDVERLVCLGAVFLVDFCYFEDRA